MNLGDAMNAIFSPLRWLLLLILVLFARPSFAQPCVLDSNANGEYLITSYDDLKKIDGVACLYSASYRLTQNIDASASATDNSGAGFISIGGAQGQRFTGKFHGAGDTISNLTINYSCSLMFSGLFGYLDATAIVDSLNLASEVFTGSTSTNGFCEMGGLAGINKGLIDHCTSTGGSVTSTSEGEIGGLVGENAGTISNSIASIPTVSSSVQGSDVGGLVGDNTGTITNSAFIGNVIGSASGYGGGLVAYNVGKITRSYSQSTVSAGTNGRSGGLVAYNLDTVSLSYSHSTVSVGDGGQDGGLIGFNEGPVSNSYSTGIVNSATVTGNTGGLIGYNGTNVGTFSTNLGSVTNCYSTSSVVGGSGDVIPGGLIGYTPSGTGGTMANSYWSVDSSGRASDGFGLSDAGLVGNQMDSASYFSGWDFDSTWIIYQGQTTPLLRALMTPMTISAAKITKPYDGQPLATKPTAIYTPSNYVDSLLLGTLTWTGTGDTATTGTSTLTPGGLYSTQKGYAITFLTDTISIVCPLASNSNGELLIGDYASLKQLEIGVCPLNATYRLTNNIDASGSATENLGAGWRPLGNDSTAFTGKFNGGGYAIDGLTINNSVNYHVGLFASLANGALVDSLGVTNAQITSTVSKVSPIGNISPTGCGVNCTPLDPVGILAGKNLGTISNTYVSGSVTGVNNDTIGGLVGANEGSLINCYSTGSATGGVNAVIGGLAGSNAGTIDRVYSTDVVVASSSSQNGGLIGYNKGSVNNAYAMGRVTGGSHTGGLIGTNESIVSNSYAEGFATGDSSVGGLIGTCMGSATNSYYNTDSTATDNSAATGLTSSQMDSAAYFSGWDFASTWIIYDGHSAPLLRTFMTPLTITAKDSTETYSGHIFAGGAGVTYSPTTVDSSLILGTPTYLGTSQGAKKAGAYGLIPNGFYSTQAGYAITADSGTLRITPDTISVIGVAATDKIYDGSTVDSLTTGTLVGIITGDTVTLVQGTGVFADKYVGHAKLVYATGFTLGGADSANYVLNNPQNLSASITPRTISVIAKADTIRQGSIDQPLNYTVTGLLLGDSLTGAETRDLGNKVGTYAILQGTLSADSNYVIAFTSANYIILAPINTAPVLTWSPSVRVSTQGQAAKFSVLNGSISEMPANTYVLLHVIGTDFDSTYTFNKQTVTWAPLAIGSYSIHFETHNEDTVLAYGNGDSSFVIQSLIKVPLKSKAWYMAGFGADSSSFAQFQSTSQIFHWEDSHAEGEYGRYANRNELVHNQPGFGYWFFADGAGDTLKPSVLSSIPVVSLSLLDANTGWNMISNPYPWPIALDTTLTYWTWDDGSYKPVQTLDALTAAWVNVTQDQTMTFNPTPFFAVDGSTTLARRLVSSYASTNNWSVQVALSADGIKDAWNFIGVGSQSNQLKPPAGFGQRISLALVEQGQSLARLIKNSTQNSTWTIALNSDQDRMGTLEFTGLSSLLQNGITLTLLLPDGSTQTLHDGSTVNVALKKGTQNATIQASIGAPTIAMQGGLGNLHIQNTDNDALQLSFTASLAQAGAPATLEVISLNGNVVAELNLGTLQAGENKTSILASRFKAGMYIFRVHTNSSQTSATWMHL